MDSRPARTYRAGSLEDFDQLYRDCYPRLVRTLYAVLGDAAAAEDCVQEAFVRAFRAWPQFKPERPPEAWLHRIAVNTAISYRRALKRREVGELVRRLGRPPAPPDPAAQSADADVIRALAALPAKLSLPFLLRHYHGYSTREIATITSTPERTVRHRIQQATDRLQKLLGTGWNDPLPQPGRQGVVLSCPEGISDA
jgi:RNA polymerase sigma-70 factor, ECF subfamily